MKDFLLSIRAWVILILIVGIVLTITNWYDRGIENDYREHRLESSRKYDISEGDDVFICTGSYSHAYHSYEGCHALEYCKGDVEEISLEDAQSDGRTPCHYCCEE